MILSDMRYPLENTSQRSLIAGEQLEMPLIIYNEEYTIKNAVFFARPLQADAELSFSTTEANDGDVAIENGIQLPVIVAAIDAITLRLQGKWFVETLKMSQVTTLFSFLDFQAKRCNDISYKYSQSADADPAIITSTPRGLVMTAESDNKTFVGMVITAMLDPKADSLKGLFTFIRGVESYWISYFLLSQVINDDKESDMHKICNASKVYGVSETYFRKLCYHAFTRGPKKQLRLWRAAYSALQLIEKDNSIATVAGNNGYASSSHFSSEIKLLFGITPREFKKLEDFLHD